MTARRPRRSGADQPRGRVLMVDEKCLTRQALCLVIAGMPNVEVVGDVPLDELLLDHIHRLSPDLAVINLTTDIRDSLGSIRILRKAKPELRLLMLVTYHCSSCVEALTRLGVEGVLTTWSDTDELCQAISAVLGDERYLGSDLLAEGNRVRNDSSPANVRLSPRQRQILELIGVGRSVREIADALQISTKTVETHRARMLNLLGIRGAKALLGYALHLQHNRSATTFRTPRQVRKILTKERPPGG